MGAHCSELGMSTAKKDLPTGKFQKLIDRLSEILGSSGIDAEHVSATQLCDIMTAYESNSKDWMPYVSEWPDADQPYTRNLVDSGNGKYNLVSHTRLYLPKITNLISRSSYWSGTQTLALAFMIIQNIVA
jgi:hypothetical protein